MAIKFDEKTKTYTVSYCKRHPKTRQPHSLRRTKIKSKAEAKRVYNELVIKVEDKIRKLTIPTWNKVLEEYSENLFNSDVSRKTVESNTLCLRKYTLPDWDGLLVNEITTLEIRNLIKEKVSHRSPSHQKNILKYIRNTFSFAVECGYLDRNPTPSMKFRIGEKIKNVLTESQVKTLLNQAKIMESEWYPIWCMALYTGMRNGELYALTWDKVNLEEGKILVDSSWNNKDGFKDTKSGDDRIVMIAPNLLYLLKELKLKNFNPPFVLPRIDKWDKGEQARELRMFLQGLGLPRIRFHDLRATWATLTLGTGVAPIKVMAMGGWKDLKTMQLYIRKAGVDVQGVIDKLDLHNPYASKLQLLEK